MATEAYKAPKPAISFSPPEKLTTEFYKETHAQNLQEAARIILNAYRDPFHAKGTPMGKELSYIMKNPEKVSDAQVLFGAEEKVRKNGAAIYSIKIATDSETCIFSLRVGDFTELSYFRNGELAERHYQKGSEVIHEIIA
ncbi:MAG: hypothetical protein WC717_00405 [Candidatus Micrarchaeia archaeon]|jgi:hypothetical protein